jgi:hypothetical protein
LAGEFLRRVATSSVASSLIYLLLVLAARLLNAHREKLFNIKRDLCFRYQMSESCPTASNQIETYHLPSPGDG